MQNSENKTYKNTPKIVFISNKVKRVHSWTEKEDETLLTKAREYNFKNWKKVSSFLPGRTDIQCSARYKRIRPGIVKGSWTKQEDKKILALIKKHGRNWSLISKNIRSRTGKQIRDRYLNTLDPNTRKDKFSQEEDKKLVKYFLEYGPAWSKIALHFEGRTGDMLKNRFYSSLKRRICKNEFSINEENNNRLLKNSEKDESSVGCKINEEITKLECVNRYQEKVEAEGIKTNDFQNECVDAHNVNNFDVNQLYNLYMNYNFLRDGYLLNYLVNYGHPIVELAYSKYYC